MHNCERFQKHTAKQLNGSLRMFKKTKTLKNLKWNSNDPTKLTVSWISVGESKSILEKQLNVSVTTPQTKRLWKSRSSINTHQNVAFKTPNLIKCLWASPKTVKIRAQLNLYCIGLGNPKYQLLAVQRYYNEKLKLKVCLKMPWFAKSCQKVCARLVTKHSIH